MNTPTNSEIEIPRLSSILEFLDSIGGDFRNLHDEQSSPEQNKLCCQTKRRMERPTSVSEGEHVPYWTELQSRKRAEARKRRVQVKLLKLQLAELQNTRQQHIKNALTLSSGDKQHNSLRWRSVVAIGCEQ